MANKIAFVLALLVVAAAAYLAGSLRAPRETVAAASGRSPQGILYYRCPMHPDPLLRHGLRARVRQRS
jgi:hypothetical protein